MKNLLFLLVLTNICCSPDINTTDPQASKDIAFSKSKQLFIKEYVENVPVDTILSLDQAWAEYGWKNTVDDTVEKNGNIQLVIKVNDRLKLEHRFGTYLTDWYLIAPQYGYFGSRNGVYDLALKDSLLPSSINIDAYQKDSLKKIIKIGNIHLTEKK